jgi:hypothetical protein
MHLIPESVKIDLDEDEIRRLIDAVAPATTASCIR